MKSHQPEHVRGENRRRHIVKKDVTVPGNFARCSGNPLQ
jgi:hypothetical protein